MIDKEFVAKIPHKQITTIHHLRLHVKMVRAVGGGCAGCATAHPVFWLLPLKMREFWP